MLGGIRWQRPPETFLLFTARICVVLPYHSSKLKLVVHTKRTYCNTAKIGWLVLEIQRFVKRFCSTLPDSVFFSYWRLIFYHYFRDWEVGYVRISDIWCCQIKHMVCWKRDITSVDDCTARNVCNIKRLVTFPNCF